MLHIQSFLENVRELWVLGFHAMLDDSELKAMIQQLSQYWLVSAQPVAIEMLPTWLAQFGNELLRHPSFVYDACKELVPMTRAD